MDALLRVLRWLNILAGGALILIGLSAFLFRGALVPMLLALALFAVGPLKDFLVQHVRLSGADPHQTRQLIDQSTTMALVVLMLAALFLSLQYVR